MFEKEINFIYDFSSNKIKKLGNFFTFEELSKTDLHPAITKYISGEISYLIYEDRQKLLRDSSFDYSNEKVEYYLNLISEELKANKRFSQKYISKMLLQAISFNIHYLVQPRASILKFIFGNSRSKTVKDIIQIMNYIYYYEYLKKLIISYLKSKKLISISIEEFEELLLKIDKLTIDSDKFGVLETGFSKITEFMNYGSGANDHISYKAALLFLKDKLLLEDRYILMNRFTEMENNKIAYSQILSYLKEKSSLSEVHEETEEIVEEEVVIEENLVLEEQEELSRKVVNEPVQKEIEENIPEDDKPDLVAESTSILEEEFEEIIFDEEEKEESTEPDSFPEDKINQEVVSEDDIIESFEENFEVEELEIDDLESSDNELFEEVLEENINEYIVSDQEEITIDEEEGSRIEEEQFELKEDSEEIINENFTDEAATSETIDEFSIREEETSAQKERDEEKVIVEESLMEDENLKGSGSKEEKIDINELLENKKMSKIIEEVFDYDMEEFSTVIDNFNFFGNFADAKSYFYDWLEKNGLSKESKSVKIFLDTIEEYYN